MKTPKVTIITTTNEGGAGYASLNLYKGFEKIGVSAQFLTLALMKKFQTGIISGLRRWWMERTHINQNFSYVKDAPPGYDYFTFPSTGYKKTHELEIVAAADVINLHWISNFIDYPTFFNNKLNKPIIWTLHDTSAFTGGCHYNFGCENFLADCSNCPQLSPQNKMVARQSLLTKLDALKSTDSSKMIVVSPSLWLKGLSERSMLFKNLRHFHIPYGVDTSVYKPTDKIIAREAIGLKGNQFVVFFAGTNVKELRKGFDLALEVREHFKHRPEITFIAAGKNAGEQPDGISRLGFIDDKKLMALIYSAADVFLLPSRQDNLPNTMLEALCCGTPVLGFNIGGVPDAVQQGHNGFLANVEDTQAMAAYIEQMLNGEVVFDNKRIAAEAAEKYALETQALAYKELMEELLQQ